MRDVMVELKQLRLHGMAGAWADLAEQGGDAGLDNARWLVEHLLQAEAVDRGMRSVKHQMHVAKFPVHRDLAGFDFDVSPVDRKLVMKRAEMEFVDQSQNVVITVLSATAGGAATLKTTSAVTVCIAISGSGFFDAIETSVVINSL